MQVLSYQALWILSVFNEAVPEIHVVAEFVWCSSASNKRRKLLGPLDDKRLNEDIPKRSKTTAITMPANLQPFAQNKASTAGQADNKQSSAAEQVINTPELKQQEPQTAVLPKEQASFDFMTWYYKICTHGFADGLSALHQDHDNSHAHPSLIARSIRMNASLLGVKESVLQTIYHPWHSSPFQHVSQWL